MRAAVARTDEIVRRIADIGFEVFFLINEAAYKAVAISVKKAFILSGRHIQPIASHTVRIMGSKMSFSFFFIKIPSW